MTDVVGTILHSDRGGEFTAHLMAKACFGHGPRRSKGATGICWDNSLAGSFWPTFKHEHYYRHVYATMSNSLLQLTIGFVSTTEYVNLTE